MNLYIRYFDFETLVYNVEEALDFLASIREINFDAQMERDIRAYVASDMLYPKRYKVRAHVYFIIIKTTAATLSDFKQKKALNPAVPAGTADPRSEAAQVMANLNKQREGWYEGEMDFKRVVMKSSGKFEYKDTHVVYRCKALSGSHCYERIRDYLLTRVDNRSQFPSMKGKNFKFRYLGMWKQL